MKIQLQKMFIYGVIGFVFYVLVPYAAFSLLNFYGFLVTTPEFLMGVLILGVIGTVILVFKHAFPKDTVANHLVGVASAVYSGLFLFFIFGGFTPGQTFGDYYINTPIIQALLGLQIFAWLFLAGAIIKGLQHFFLAFEVKDKKRDQEEGKKGFRASSIFKIASIVIGIAIAGFIGSIIISGMLVRFNFNDMFLVQHHDPGTPLDPSDDILNITSSFDLSNMGIYGFNDIELNVDLFTLTTANDTVLPENTKIGEVQNVSFTEFPAFTVVTNQTFVIDINPAYIEGMLTIDNAQLEVRISIILSYAWIGINVNITLPPIDWDPTP